MQSYALDSLTSDASIMGNASQPKVAMKELFAVPMLRADGTPGTARKLPPVELLQRNEATRSRWYAPAHEPHETFAPLPQRDRLGIPRRRIKYSAYDAKACWHLMEELRLRLTVGTRRVLGQPS